MRLDVVGLPASGKSTFAENVSRELSIPHIHLDRFWFESGGKQGRFDTPNLNEVRARVREKVKEAVEQKSWVSDGIYLHVQDLIAAKADVIVYLDIPLWKRLFNHAIRTFLEPRKHGELTFWDNLSFFKEIVRREFSSGSKLRQFVIENQIKVVRLTSNSQANEYVNSLVL